MHGPSQIPYLAFQIGVCGTAEAAEQGKLLYVVLSTAQSNENAWL